MEEAGGDEPEKLTVAGAVPMRTAVPVTGWTPLTMLPAGLEAKPVPKIREYFE